MTMWIRKAGRTTAVRERWLDGRTLPTNLSLQSKSLQEVGDHITDERGLSSDDAPCPRSLENDIPFKQASFQVLTSLF